MIVFDVETAPLDEATVLKYCPFVEPPPPAAEFDPGTVKLGGLKDPAKIEAKIEEARQKHAALIANYAAQVEIDRRNHIAEAMDRATLQSHSCQILAIGYESLTNGKVLLSTKPEQELLTEFWKRYEDCRKSRRRMVGHNTIEFDVPMIMQRSWIHGINVPPTILEKHRWMDPIIGDTMKQWQAGTRQQYIKLDVLSELLGGPRKPEGMTGKQFHHFFLSDHEADQRAALDYLRNDLRMTMHVAVALGFH